MMLFRGDMSELEIEEVDSGDPPVDCHVGLAVWIVEHAADEGGVHLDDQGANAYEI